MASVIDQKIQTIINARNNLYKFIPPTSPKWDKLIDSVDKPLYMSIQTIRSQDEHIKGLKRKYDKLMSAYEDILRKGDDK